MRFRLLGTYSILLLAPALLSCRTTRTIAINPHITVVASHPEIVAASKQWLVVRGYEVLSASEYLVKGERKSGGILTVATHGGKVSHFIEITYYPRGDSTEVDLFSYTVGSNPMSANQPVIENDPDLLEEYQQGLDSLAKLLAR
jgi:hypothetical protein